MSNEELVASIQNGETHQIETLLSQNAGVIRKVASRYLGLARRNRALDLDDLLQACRVGMILAVDAYDPERGSFLALAILHMKSEVRRELGISSSKQAIETSQTVASLDESIEGGEGATLADLLVDEDAASPQDSAELSDMQQTVREAVMALPEAPKRVVEAHFLQGIPYAHISLEGRSYANIADLGRRGLQSLRRNNNLRKLWAEYEGAAQRHKTLTAWRYTHTSAVEDAAITREELLKRILGH